MQEACSERPGEGLSSRKSENASFVILLAGYSFNFLTKLFQAYIFYKLFGLLQCSHESYFPLPVIAFTQVRRLTFHLTARRSNMVAMEGRRGGSKRMLGPVWSRTNACSPNAMGPILWRRAGCRDSLQARLGCRLVTPTSQSAIPDPLRIPRQLFRTSGRRIGPGYLRTSEAQSPRPQGSVASCDADRDRVHS